MDARKHFNIYLRDRDLREDGDFLEERDFREEPVGADRDVRDRDFLAFERFFGFSLATYFGAYVELRPLEDRPLLPCLEIDMLSRSADKSSSIDLDFLPLEDLDFFETDM